MDDLPYAPGWPGIPPRWTSSAKSGVGTALNPASRVWFTLSHGIINEIYYPRIDSACTRDLGFIVTDGLTFFSEEKRDTRCEIAALVPGVPGYQLTNTCGLGRYRIEKEIVAGPWSDVVLQRIRLAPLEGGLGDYRLYMLLAPHLGNRGSGNTAWVGDYKGVPMLLVERDGHALAVACSAPWVGRSVGFVGSSDGWQDLMRHKRMTWHYTRAENGNVALSGEVDLGATRGEFVLAVGLGRNSAEAGHSALAGLLVDFERARAAYVNAWKTWQRSLLPLRHNDAGSPDLYRASAAVLRAHESKRFQGGLIAGLSIPWGFAKGDDDLGGYHLVWPRDLAEAAGALLAAGAKDDARRVIRYLHVTQEADGHWSQNMWMDGTPYWSGVQMDETALPILLVDLARRERVLDSRDISRLWPMVRRAAAYIVTNGPVSQQDRWEEDPGYSPFTLATEVAALLAAADLADVNGESGVATYLRETADTWNASIERWIYVSGTDLARTLGIDGYYVRIGPVEASEASSALQGFVPIKNRPPGQTKAPATHVVSPDALALVRFGLRAPDDPRIISTTRAIDALLKVELPGGPAWHRYNGDGYGEHVDGSPFDGTGVGRPWPLLTGERAHYELAVGNYAGAEKLRRALESFANEGGMLSEQLWDAPDIPERELYFGRPSGSAMPLVWAHAEYVKLRRSLRDGRVFDMPPQPAQRYLVDKRDSRHGIWRFNHKSRTLTAGRILRVETLAPAVVHWSADGWRTVHDTDTRDTSLGVHLADLPTSEVPSGSLITFTFFWRGTDRWEGRDFAVTVEEQQS
jgi:glucoamylase